jgi:hypothetical protein
MLTPPTRPPAISDTSGSESAIVVRHVCKACGGEVPGPTRPGGRERRFCSDACRAAAYRRRLQGIDESAARQPMSRDHGRMRLAEILQLEVDS